MSKYTTELRFIIGSLAGSTDTSLSQLKKDIPKALPLIFDGDLSLDSPLSITTFETLFLNHFAFHEIGFETFARWKYEINNHLREIIPYYNDLSSSTTKEFSFFLTSPGYTDTINDVTGTETTTGGTTTNNLSTETEASEDYTSAYSDTPNGSLTDVKNLNYLSTATVDDRTNTQTTTNTGTVTTSNTGDQTVTKNYELEHIETIRGEDNLKAIKLFREEIKNIYSLMLDEFNEYFITLWG